VLPSLKSSAIDVGQNVNEAKAARSDKPISPMHSTKFEDGMLPEQIIAINNPDFVLNTEDASYHKTLGEPTNKNVFKSKRNTSHAIGDKNPHKIGKNYDQSARLAAPDPS
jgi:hypothetical protein